MGEQENKEHLFYLNFYDANNNIALSGNLNAGNIANLNSHAENNRTSEFSMYDDTLTNLANIIQSASANFEYDLLNKFIAKLNVNNSKNYLNMNHSIDELELRNLDNLLIKSKWSIKLSNGIDNGLKSTKFLIEQNSINVKANIIFENCSLECDLCKLNINLNNLTNLFAKIFRLTLIHKIEDMVLFVNKYSLISIVLMIEKHKCNMRFSYLQAVLKNFFKCLVDSLSSKFFNSLSSLQTEFPNGVKLEEYSKLSNDINCLLDNLDNIFYQNKNLDSNIGNGQLLKSSEKTIPRPDVIMTKSQTDHSIQENRTSMKSNEIILKAINKRKLQISCPLCSSKVLNMSDHLLKKHLIKDRKQRKSIMDSIRKTFLDMSVKSLSSSENNSSTNGDSNAAESSTNHLQQKNSHSSSRKLIKCPICEDNKHFVNISDHLIKIHHLIDSEKRRHILKQIKQRISSKSFSSNKIRNSNNHDHNGSLSNLDENPTNEISSVCANKLSESDKAPTKKINKRKQKKTTKLIKIEEEADAMKNNNNIGERLDDYQAQEQENLFDNHHHHHHHHQHHNHNHNHNHHHRHHNSHSPKTLSNTFSNNTVVNEKRFEYLAQHSSEPNINELNKRSELSYSKSIEYLEDNEFESNRALHDHHSHNLNHEPIENNLEKSQELDKDIEFDINSDDLLHEQTSSLIGEQRLNENLNEYLDNHNNSSQHNNNNNNNASNLNHHIDQQLYHSNEHVLNRLVQIEDNLTNLMNSFSSLSEIINKQMRSFSSQLEYTFNEVKSLKNSLLLSPSNQSLESLMSNNNEHLTSNHNNADTLNDLSSNHQVNLNEAFNFDNNNNNNNIINNNNKHICNTDHSSTISSSSSSSSIVNFQHFIQQQDSRMISLEANLIDSFGSVNHDSTVHEVHHQQNKSNFDIETEAHFSVNSEANFYENIDRDFYQKQMEILAGEKFFLRTSKFTIDKYTCNNNTSYNQIAKNYLIDSIKLANKKGKAKENL
jgi:hypothetical protein